MKNLRIGLLILIGLTGFISSFGQRTYNGKVSEVLDGKTVVVDTGTGIITAELQNIEIPDTGHPFYKTVRNHLRELVFGKKVVFQLQGFSDERLTGQLYLDGVDIAQQMLRDGAAWLAPTGFNSQTKAVSTVYASNQEQAKTEKRGLWAGGDAKPKGLIKAEQIEFEVLQEELARANPFANGDQSYKPSAKADSVANKNPRMGNVGALLNSYDPQTKTGYLSTGLVGLGLSDDEAQRDVCMAVDLTYYYKEDDRKGRKSVYEFTVVSAAHKTEFAVDNDLWMFTDGGRSKIGSPKRAFSKRGDQYLETLKYQISKTTMTRLVNNQTYLKVGNHVIILTGLRYLLVPMLQAAG